MKSPLEVYVDQALDRAGLAGGSNISLRSALINALRPFFNELETKGADFFKYRDPVTGLPDPTKTQLELYEGASRRMRRVSFTPAAYLWI